MLYVIFDIGGIFLPPRWKEKNEGLFDREISSKPCILLQE